MFQKQIIVFWIMWNSYDVGIWIKWNKMFVFIVYDLVKQRDLVRVGNSCKVINNTEWCNGTLPLSLGTQSAPAAIWQWRSTAM